MIDEEYQAVDRVQRWRESGGWKVTLVWLVGYNPQRLLTDQRGELAKFASGGVLGEPYEGTATGRWSGRVFRSQEPKMHRFPAMLPVGEAVLPKDHPLVGTDYRKVEERVLAHYTIPVQKLGDTYGKVGYAAEMAAAGAERFNASMRDYQEQLARWQEKVYLRMIFATQLDSQPGNMFHREYRIGQLLFSPDRRQQKRGNRLFDKWHKTRSGINWTRDEKRELLRRGYGRAR